MIFEVFTSGPGGVLPNITEYREMKKICGNCKWWDDKPYDESWEEFPSPQHYCTFLQSADGMDFACAEYGDADIVTSPNFGCIFWKKK